MMIRPAQVTALRRSSKDTFAQRVATLVRDRLPKQSEPFKDEELLGECKTQIECARMAGLRSEHDQASFVVFRFKAGADFRSRPPYDAIWASSDSQGSAKVAKTRELMSARGSHSGIGR